MTICCHDPRRLTLLFPCPFRDGLERVEVADSATVGQLKEAIHTKLNIPLQDMVLSLDPQLVRGASSKPLCFLPPCERLPNSLMLALLLRSPPPQCSFLLFLLSSSRTRTTT